MMCLKKWLRLFITCVLFPYTNLFLVLQEKLTCNRLLTRYKLISISVNNASRECTLLFLPEWLKQSISCKRQRGPMIRARSKFGISRSLCGGITPRAIWPLGRTGLPRENPPMEDRATLNSDGTRRHLDTRVSSAVLLLLLVALAHSLSSLPSNSSITRAKPGRWASLSVSRN